MFMVAIIGVVLIAGIALAIIIVRKNHNSRNGQSGLAEATKQTLVSSDPGSKRAYMGND